jgi:hypothetical protein
VFITFFDYRAFCEAMVPTGTYLPCTERRYLYLSAPPSTHPARGLSAHPRKGAYGVAGMRVVRGGVDAANEMGRSSLTTDTIEKFVSDAARPLKTQATGASLAHAGMWCLLSAAGGIRTATTSASNVRGVGALPPRGRRRARRSLRFRGA